MHRMRYAVVGVAAMLVWVPCASAQAPAAGKAAAKADAKTAAAAKDAGAGLKEPAAAKGTRAESILGKLDIGAGKEDTEEALQAEMGEAKAGDLKEFTVRTEDDITVLEVGDIYKSNASYFKVVSIAKKAKKGGKFLVQRTSGDANPSRYWNRVSGLGPLTVTSRETVWDLYLAGGSIMHPIALCGVGTIILAINGLFIYRHRRQCPPAFVDQANAALRAGDLGRFETLASQEKSLIGQICRSMTVDFKASNIDEIRIRCEAESNRQVGRLRIPLKALNFIAAVAPMLGLFGTVTGMVTCFEAIAFESASASKAVTLAAGIRVALFTTVGGLAVAMPALLVMFLYNTRMAGILAECEMVSEQLLHHLALIKGGGDKGKG